MKIAVVCAVNIDQNPGMVTVDRAAKAFFSNRGLDVDYLIAGATSDHRPGVDDLSDFVSVFEADGYPHKYDRIVFWGDFLQSRVHHENLSEHLIKSGISSSNEHALYILRKYLLLEGESKDTLSKVAIIGSSVHPDNKYYFEDSRYLDAFTKLLENACCVRMRDPLSSYLVSIITGRDGTCGMDAAFLEINNYSWNFSSAVNRKNGPVRIAVVGGRSNRSRGRKLKISVLTAIWHFKKNGIQASIEVLPWLTGSLGKWVFTKVENKSSNRSTDYCLGRMLNCDALVTDVYHAAINAWIRGIPVVLLGSGAEFDTSTIQSKKKELLSLSLFAGNNYLFYEDISIGKYFNIGSIIFDCLTNESKNYEIFKQRQHDVSLLINKIEAEIGIPIKNVQD